MTHPHHTRGRLDVKSNKTEQPERSTPGHSLRANFKMISRDLGWARRSNDKKCGLYWNFVLRGGGSSSDRICQ